MDKLTEVIEVGGQIIVAYEEEEPPALSVSELLRPYRPLVRFEHIGSASAHARGNGDKS